MKCLKILSVVMFLFLLVILSGLSGCTTTNPYYAPQHSLDYTLDSKGRPICWDCDGKGYIVDAIGSRDICLYCNGLGWRRLYLTGLATY